MNEKRSFLESLDKVKTIVSDYGFYFTATCLLNVIVEQSLNLIFIRTVNQMNALYSEIHGRQNTVQRLTLWWQRYLLISE